MDSCHLAQHVDSLITNLLHVQFLECCDPNVCEIQARNYGIKTDLKTEWEFVVSPQPGRIDISLFFAFYLFLS